MYDKKSITYSRVFYRNGHLLSYFIIFFVRFEASNFSSSLLFWTILAAIWCVYAQLCLSLCNPMDCSLPGSSVLGIFQARILEWVAISYSRLIFLTQGSDLSLLCFLHWQAGSLPLGPLSWWRREWRNHLQCRRPSLIPGQKDPSEKVMATHSSSLAWKIPWTEEPGGL